MINLCTVTTPVNPRNPIPWLSNENNTLYNRCPKGLPTSFDSPPSKGYLYSCNVSWLIQMVTIVWIIIIIIIISVESTEWLLLHCFQVELEFGNVGFCGGRKTGVPGEKPLEQRREPTTNSTHILRRDQESNPGHTGGRRVLSPVPLRNKILTQSCRILTSNEMFTS